MQTSLDYSWKQGDARATIPRRVIWGARKVKVLLKDGPTEFEWTGLAREYNTETRQWVNLSTPKYQLSDRDNPVVTERFDSMIEMKTYVIRWCYDLKGGTLIPSELLADAHLRYQDRELWVDDFFSHGDNVIVEDYELIVRPVDRKVRLPVYQDRPSAPPTMPSRRPGAPRVYHPPGSDRVPMDTEVQRWLAARAAYERREVGFPSIEPSDEQCTYTLETHKCECVWTPERIVKLLRERLVERFDSRALLNTEEEVYGTA